jgi:hypothetical protein
MTSKSLKETPPARLRLKVLPGAYAVCRLAPHHPIPAWFRPGALAAATYTDDELSLVVADEDVPDGVEAERDWRVFKVEGPLDFSLTGILSSVAAPLAEAQISLFALSTYDTDYVLVRAGTLQAARAVLCERFDVTG